MIIQSTGKIGLRPDLDTPEKVEALVGQPFMGEDNATQIGVVTKAWRESEADGGEVVVEVDVDDLLLKGDYARGELRRKTDAPITTGQEPR